MLPYLVECSLLHAVFMVGLGLGLGLGLVLDLVYGWLVVMHKYIYYFPLSLYCIRFEQYRIILGCVFLLTGCLRGSSLNAYKSHKNLPGHGSNIKKPQRRRNITSVPIKE